MKTTAERIAIIKAGLEKSRQRCTSEAQFLDGVAHLIDSLNCIIENRTDELEAAYDQRDEAQQDALDAAAAFAYERDIVDISLSLLQG